MVGNGATAGRLLAALLALAASCLPGTAVGGTAAAAAACPDALVRAMPPRPPGAPTGSGFVRRVAGLSEAEREVVIGAELLAGNLPGFMRQLRPVNLRGRRPEGGTVSVTICVTPDYLALGSDDDFLRIPMGLPTAVAVADRLGFVLPTPKMVDAIYEQAEVHLPPQPLPPGPEMRSTAYFWNHDGRIRQQRAAIGAPLGALTAGQKKDLVITNRLRSHPGRVAIYGWHRSSGNPIQPLSTVHGAGYADYSHGVRLVSAIAYVDGQPRWLPELLEDPRLAPVLSDEGPIPHLTALAGGPRPGGLQRVNLRR